MEEVGFVQSITSSNQGKLKFVKSEEERVIKDERHLTHSSVICCFISQIYDS